ncbi:MAG: Na+/H+ antiporter NhaA [Alphaproteobacteria bacterium]|nr:Na+/H+ antiporter NhaA [Alphaproteobacteria bacterium]
MVERALSSIRDFLRLESASGMILLGAAVLALLVENSALAPLYDQLLGTTAAVQIGELKISKPLLLWINDGLMAIFFLLVGLEIKREIVAGELSNWQRASLPVFGAIGGMAFPALIFVAINLNTPETLNGWAIPAATDIAFALGLLALVGPGIPVSVKVFLLGLAILDDLGAIIIIALFYTADLSVGALGLAAAGLAGLFALNRAGVRTLTPYILVGVFIWVCVLKSGVHATLAGVAVALFIPMDRSGADDHAHCPLRHLEHTLHPWVAFMIMPLFAFANAGVSFEGLGLAGLLAPLPLGIAAGLFIGKQLGVMTLVFTAVKLGLARLPEGVSWGMFYGAALLTGVGFTMSLFIGTLAFADPAFADDVRLGVLAGSVLSGVAGFLVLKMSARRSVVTAPARSQPLP